MAGDFYLNVVDTKTGFVKGESIDVTYTDEIQISNFSIGVRGPELSDEASADSGHCDFEEAEFEMPASVASSALFYLCCSGEILKTVTLTCRKGGGGGKPQTFLQWRFHRAQISSYKMTPSDNDTPTETIRLKFAKLEIAYTRQKPDGTLEATPHQSGWDQDQNGSLKSTLPHPKK